MVSAEIKFPALVIVDGQLRIPISKKGGFSFDGSSVVIDLEVTDTESAAAQDPPPANGNGRRGKSKDDNPAGPPPLPPNITNPGNKGA